MPKWCPASSYGSFKMLICKNKFSNNNNNLGRCVFCWPHNNLLNFRIYNFGTYGNLLALLLRSLDHFGAVRFPVQHATKFRKRWILLACSVGWTVSYRTLLWSSCFFLSTFYADAHNNLVLIVEIWFLVNSNFY